MRYCSSPPTIMLFVFKNSRLAKIECQYAATQPTSYIVHIKTSLFMSYKHFSRTCVFAPHVVCNFQQHTNQTERILHILFQSWQINVGGEFKQFVYREQGKLESKVRLHGH